MSKREKYASPLPGQLYEVVAQLGDYDADVPRYFMKKPRSADVITSLVDDDLPLHEDGTALFGPWEQKHKLILDIDLPAKLIPSTTEGHFHLYIDKEMTWEQYENVLIALSAAGIIEEGYLGASASRGYTSVRLPWIVKDGTTRPEGGQG